MDMHTTSPCLELAVKPSQGLRDYRLLMLLLPLLIALAGQHPQTVRQLIDWLEQQV